ncbi:hypothetical protein NE237_024438 [Protea cynaroides]|uniref:Transmembrane protein n=1 Tax=Protea cynaroides TaxID=273540 RepID=A0A9Q0HEM7_9MAGN|nr:hypothetical protein NE237_024438 [Protea cynaroides]
MSREKVRKRESRKQREGGRRRSSSGDLVRRRRWWLGATGDGGSLVQRWKLQQRNRFVVLRSEFHFGIFEKPDFRSRFWYFIPAILTIFLCRLLLLQPDLVGFFRHRRICS